MGKILILSIGINTYPNLPDDEQLNYCANDAELIHKNYSQFHYLYDNLLLNQNATRIEIQKGIADISRKARDEDYVIFNFAGHGFTIESENDKINSKNSFICPYDFDADYWELTAISFFELNDSINQIKSNSKLILFDACHSGGALRRNLSGTKLREVKIDKLISMIGDNEGTGILTACNSDEVAREDHNIQHGIFTHNLVNTLESVNSDAYLVPFDEVYSEVLMKVRAATKNEQNPQAKKSDDDFKILMMHKTESMGMKNIKLDTSIVPTSKLHKPYELCLPEDLDDFEKKVIQLIQDKRFIEIDILFKNMLNEVFKVISAPNVSLSAKSDEAIPYYESCREHLKPIHILNYYLLKYSEQKYIVENLEYVFQFESLIKGKSGTTAIIEIPITLISEICLYLMPIAYQNRSIDVLKMLITHITTTNYGDSSPIVYHDRFWCPLLFKGDVVSFVKYLFPKETRDDILADSKMRNLNEITFLFDCYSLVSDGMYRSHPTYLVFNDVTTPKRVLSNLSDPNYAAFVENLFSIEIKDFINLIIMRQKQISKWGNVHFEIKMQIADSIAGFENMVKRLK